MSMEKTRNVNMVFECGFTGKIYDIYTVFILSQKNLFTKLDCLFRDVVVRRLTSHKFVKIIQQIKPYTTNLFRQKKKKFIIKIV